MDRPGFQANGVAIIILLYHQSCFLSPYPNEVEKHQLCYDSNSISKFGEKESLQLCEFTNIHYNYITLK